MAEILEKHVSISNELSTNRKPIHGGQRVCEENKLELEKKRNLGETFWVKGSTLKGCRRTVKLLIGAILTTRILHSIKVIVQ